MNRSTVRTVATAIVAAILTSCAAATELTTQEDSTLAVAKSAPLTFSVHREDARGAWDRAQEFVDRYSTMTRRVISDSSIVVQDPPEPVTQFPTASTTKVIKFGYAITQFATGDSVRISVNCVSNNHLGDENAKTNAHLASYYVRTGIMACARCIVR